MMVATMDSLTCRQMLRYGSRGGIAQLVERLTGSQEVRGSNPLTSTIGFLFEPLLEVPPAQGIGATPTIVTAFWFTRLFPSISGGPQNWMSSEKRSAISNAILFSGPRRPTGSSSSRDFGIVTRLSELMTHTSGSPSSKLSSTSERIFLIVRVIGAHVTDVSTSIAASLVTTHTGLRPASPPRSAQ